MKKTFLMFALFMGSITSYAQTGGVGKINNLVKEMETEFNANKMMKVSAYYLDSAVIMGGGMNITGRTGIDNYWGALQDKSASWKLETDKIEDYDQVIIQRGRSYLSSASGMKSNVRFIVIWKKTGDTYRILYDSFTRL